MIEIIKKIIFKLYPELNAGLHTPIFAVVTSVPDAPEKDSVSDQYREYIAVNVRLLDHEMRIDENIEEIKSVPVAGQVFGNYRGTIQLPEAGIIVEIAYAYGKMTMPFIRSILPYRMNLRPTESDSTLLQNNISSFQECDRSGNWTRKTDANINDSSNNHITEAIQKLENLTNELRTIKGYSYERTFGLKKLVAGAVKFISLGSAHLGAAFNLNLTSGLDTNINTAENRNDNVLGMRTNMTTGPITDIAAAARANFTTGLLSDSCEKARINSTIEDFTDNVGKNRIVNTGLNYSDNTVGTHSIKALQVWLGSPSENSLNIVIEYMATVISALTVIASHTHSKVGAPPNQEAKIKQQATAVIQEKTRMETISMK